MIFAFGKMNGWELAQNTVSQLATQSVASVAFVQCEHLMIKLLSKRIFNLTRNNSINII